MAQASIIGEEFIGDESVALVLGDNMIARSIEEKPTEPKSNYAMPGLLLLR